MQMAPNSIFNFLFLMKNEMEAGTYVLAMTVEGSGKNGNLRKNLRSQRGSKNI